MIIVCPQYDIDPVSEIARKGIDTLINIAASPYDIDKGALRLELIKNLSKKHNFTTIYCNQVGGNDDLLFDGSSLVVDHSGKLICLPRHINLPGC